MANSSVEVKGLKEFRNALREADGNWPKQLTKAGKEAARIGADRAQAIATGLPNKEQQKAASAIRPYATQLKTSIGINANSVPWANAAFWGMLRRTGWYANPKYRGSLARRAATKLTRGLVKARGGLQHPMWVGNSWEAGVAGQGPYAINQAIAETIDDIIGAYQKSVEELYSKAFPH